MTVKFILSIFFIIQIKKISDSKKNESTNLELPEKSNCLCR